MQKKREKVVLINFCIYLLTVETDAYKVNAKGSLVLDYASESDSDVEPSMLDNVWRAQDQESSDAESVDSQLEDPLK